VLTDDQKGDRGHRMRPGAMVMKRYLQDTNGRYRPGTLGIVGRLDHRQRMFIRYYLGEHAGDAQAAARAAGFNHPKLAASALLANPNITAAIESALDAAGFSEEEIVGRLEDIANIDIGPYVRQDEEGLVEIDLNKMRRRGFTRHIKAISTDGQGKIRKLETHDAHAALMSLAKIKGMLQEGGDGAMPVVVNVIKSERNGPPPSPLDVIDVEAMDALPAPEAE
jgi:hypothetical protein